MDTRRTRVEPVNSAESFIQKIRKNNIKYVIYENIDIKGEASLLHNTSISHQTLWTKRLDPKTGTTLLCNRKETVQFP